MSANIELSAAPAGGRIGRPTLPPDERRRHTAARFRKEVKDQLEVAAENSGRSMSAEIEHRIEQSFQADRIVGSHRLLHLQQLIGLVINRIEADTGESFTRDIATFAQVKGAVEAALLTMCPVETPALAEQIELEAGPKPPEQRLIEGPAVVMALENKVHMAKVLDLAKQRVSWLNSNVAAGKRVAEIILSVTTKED